MSETGRHLARAGLIVTGAYLASRLLGWFRLVVFGAIFGASSSLDAYFAAFRIPDALFQLVAAGALGAALIPVLAALFAEGKDDAAWRVVSNLIDLMLVGLLVLTVVLEIAAPWIVPLITPGFDPAETELTIQLTRLMLLSPIFLALGAIVGSALNARNRFAAAAWAPLLYNVAIIAAALLFSRAMGVTALAVGVVVGAALSLGVQIRPLMGAGLRFHWRIRLPDPPTHRVLLLALPRALGLGATQITFLVNTTLASALGTGAIVDYNIAFTVLQIPIGVIGVPLGIVLLPSLSRAHALGEGREFGRLVVRALRLLLYVMLFVTTVTMVLRTEIVTLLFNYGHFDTQAVDETAQTLLYFMIGLAADSLVVVLARAFYAGQETRIPVAAAIVAVVVNVTVSLGTVGWLGLRGLALGIAVGAWVEAVLLVFILARRTSGLRVRSLTAAGLVFGAGALLAAAASYAVMALFPAAPADEGKAALLLQTGLAAAAAAVVYGGYSLVFRIPELPETARLLRASLRRTSS